MKKAEDIFNNFIDQDITYSRKEWQKDCILAIKQAQLDAIEETVKLCAEKAEAKASEPTPLKQGLNIISFFEVDKQSILNCAEILKQQL